MIKIFEDFNKKEITNYFVWNSNNTIKIWVYDFCFFKDGEFINYHNDNKSTWINIDDPELLFYSNDLEKCEEFIELHYSANKYNL